LTLIFCNIDMKRIEPAANRPWVMVNLAAISLRLAVIGSSALLLALGANAQTRSQWDDQLLKAEIRDIRIKPSGIWAAWQEITTKYLLRANLVLAGDPNSVSTVFTFEKKRASGKDLLDAFVGAYSDYTYTQDPGTGVVWIHPKALKYDEILSQKVMVAHLGHQVPFWKAILLPLYRLLNSGISMPGTSGDPSMQFGYGVDLQPGVYRARDILNACCTANPMQMFQMGPAGDPRGGYYLTPRFADYPNPVAPPRALAVKFWEAEIGKSNSTNGIPTAREVASAMSATDFRVRWAARAYLETTFLTYRWGDLLKSCDNPDQAVWVALGILAATSRGIINDQFLFTGTEVRASGFPDLLSRVKDPRVALLACLEVAREDGDTGFLDALVASHHYSDAEISSILPDIWRMAHHSSVVAEKLQRLNLSVAELSPENMRELEAPLLLAAPAAGKSGP
jgi:hypothetical protein